MYVEPARRPPASVPATTYPHQVSSPTDFVSTIQQGAGTSEGGAEVQTSANAGGQLVDPSMLSQKLGALNGAIQNLKDNATRNFKDAKPLAEVFDMSMVSKPKDTNEVLSRVKNNVSYFKTNYAILAVGTTAAVMLMNPWSLMIMSFLALGWFYVYVLKSSASVVIGGREFSERETFLAMSGGSLFVIFFLTSVGATIFYALGLSMILIGAHATMRIPDDTTLFSEEVPREGEGSLAGLLSMFRPKATLENLASNV